MRNILSAVVGVLFLLIATMIIILDFTLLYEIGQAAMIFNIVAVLVDLLAIFITSVIAMAFGMFAFFIFQEIRSKK